jgi:hypothetical protein
VPVFLVLLVKVADAALSGIIGNRADALMMRLSGDREWVDRAARLVAKASPLKLSRKQWTEILRSQAAWEDVVSVASESAVNGESTPKSLGRLAAMLPPPADRATENDRLEAAALLVLSVLLEASPEARAAMATVPALARVLAERDAAERHRATREAREALPLRRPRLRRPAGIPELSPSGLLVADNGVVPLRRSGRAARAPHRVVPLTGPACGNGGERGGWDW